MSTAVDAAVAKAEDRSVLATRRLCETLGLGTLKPKDLKHLTVALAEVAIQEMAHNPAFAEQVLALYRDMADAKKPSHSGGRSKAQAKQPKRKLVPIQMVDPALFAPDRPVDPYVLLHAYGHHQLRSALEEFPAAELKKAAAIVEQRNPGTKPTSRSQKAALVDYIALYVLEQ